MKILVTGASGFIGHNVVRFLESQGHECFGIDSYEGEKCQTKASKMIVHEASVKTTYYIAIIILISLYSLIILSDIDKYFIMIKRNTSKLVKSRRCC